jgi:APA family basic amino acid/polyamine antiporter
LVIQTGTIAAVTVAFARFAGVLWPGIGSRVIFGGAHFGLTTEQLGAIVLIAMLTAVNLRGIDSGKAVQNIFTSAKVLSLVLIVFVALVVAPNHAALEANFGSRESFFGSQGFSLPLIAAFGAAMVGGLFSADAWATVTFTAAEVRNPARDLPLSLMVGTGLVILLYLLTNFGYLAELPLHGNAAATDVVGRGIAGAQADRVAAAAMHVVWGRTGAALTAALVMISTLGCANGLILTGARVTYAMAKDGMFVGAAQQLNRASVPGVALIMQAVWAAVLTLSGSYGELLDYVVFAQLVFYVLTVGAVFVLRSTKPDAPRPYRTWGYPWVPAAYIVAAVALMADLLIVKPRYTWAGLLIVLSGLPVYALRSRFPSAATEPAVRRAAP